MVFKKIIKNIDNNIISPVYLLYGEEEYFIRLNASLIQKELKWEKK